MPILGSSSSQSGRTPGQPTGVSATGGDAQATVSFTPPSYTGKGTVSYTVTSSPGGFTASGSSSPITVTGLSNGTAYTFTVTAAAAGVQGTASAASGSVTPVLPAYALSQTFNASGTYTVPSGKSQIAVIGVGGGAAGRTGHDLYINPGGGGGGVGGFKDYTVAPGQTFSVTIGSGGNVNSVNGGTSSFSTLLSLGGSIHNNFGNRASDVGVGGTANSNVAGAILSAGASGGKADQNVGNNPGRAGYAGDSGPTINLSDANIPSYQGGAGGGGGGAGAYIRSANANGSGGAGGGSSSPGGGSGGAGGGSNSPNTFNNPGNGNAGSAKGAGGGGGGAPALRDYFSNNNQADVIVIGNYGTAGIGSSGQILVYAR